MRCDLCTEKPCTNGSACTACDAQALYSAPEEHRVMRAASEVEAEYYGEKNRIEEIIIFAQKMGYKKIGLAFCMAFSEEVAKLCALLSKYFDIETVNCKVCGVPKAEIGAMESDKIGPVSCNPVQQANILQEAGTELNLMLGLCVGHDALFLKHSHCLTVPVAVKDRVLAHNPMGALYCSAIYKKMMRQADAENAAEGK